MKRVLGMLLLAVVVVGWTSVASADHGWQRDRDCAPNHRPTAHSSYYHNSPSNWDRHDVRRYDVRRYDDRCDDGRAHWNGNFPTQRPPVVTGYRGPIYRPSYYVAPPAPRGLQYNGRNFNLSIGY